MHRMTRWAVVALVFLLGMTFPGSAGQDHGDLVRGPFQTGEEVTRACLQCHEGQAKALMQTPHWKWQGKPLALAGAASDAREIGKMSLINNFCISIEGGDSPSNREKCAKCHPSYGWVDGRFDFSDPAKIDCLVCHALAGNYHKADGGFPDPDLMKHGKLDLLAAARSVGAPTRDNCGWCHFYGAGGDAVKHGDLDSTLSSPSRDLDVHMGGASHFACQACHTTKEHRIAGASTVTVTHSGRVDCSDCHAEPHKASSKREILGRHIKTLACQTCHIPAFARGQATQMSWDWSEAGQDIEPEEQFDRETYAKKDGRFVWGMNVVPVYAWYNGTVRRALKGDQVPIGAEPFVLGSPAGSREDPDSRIYPFKVHTGKQPMDSKFRYLLTPLTYKGYWVNNDWKKALADGVKGSGLEFSGTFEFVPTIQYLGIQHQVAPKEKALACGECHGKGTRLDWKQLGYPGDPMKFGGRKLKAATQQEGEGK